jgi:hypothetical protein
MTDILIMPDGSRWKPSTSSDIMPEQIAGGSG